MTIHLRIRRRFFTAGQAQRTPWLWTPLALVFRTRRLPPRPAPAASSAAPQAIRPISFFTRHLHYYTQQGVQALLRGAMRETLVRERWRVNPGQGTAAVPPVQTTHHALPPNHDRLADVRLLLRISRQVEHQNTRLYRSEREIREATKTRLMRLPATEMVTIMATERRQQPKLAAWPVTAHRILAPRVRPLQRTAESRFEPSQAKTAQETLRRWRTEEQVRAAQPLGLLAAPLPPQQIWRAKQPRVYQAGETAPPASQPVSHSLTSLSAASVAAAPRGFSLDHPAAGVLHGPEIDRMADYVMKKIERRVRIERERRGR